MDLDIATVAIYSEDDANGLHLRIADEAVALGGRGVRAYLDIEDVVAKAAAANCDAIHPGYGFLAENADFAAACAEAGITFVGPRPEVLKLFGNKGKARTAAGAADVPVLRGTDHTTTLEETREFFAALGEGRAMIIKALAGGGGRGARIVATAATSTRRTNAAAPKPNALSATAVSTSRNSSRAPATSRSSSSATRPVAWSTSASASAAPSAGTRRWSKRRRRRTWGRKIRQAIIDAALRLGGAARYSSLGTFEFLVDAGDGAGGDNGGAGRFAFIETNARLQVEHTVTEAVTGVDLVQAQLRVARGESLADLDLEDPDARRARGFAIQARVNLETLDADGNVRPSSGVLAAYEPPSGPGVRVDGCGYAGYEPNPAFDSLLAKVIAHSPSEDFAASVRRASRALDEFRIGGPSTNIPWLQSVLAHPDFEAGRLYTRWLDDNAGDLAAAASNGRRPRFVPAADPGAGGPSPFRRRQRP